MNKILIATILIVPVLSAPQQNFGWTKPEIANQKLKGPIMPYEDLEYIIKLRSGEEVPPRTLSPCATAILGCCNGKIMNSNCSETLKCGAFFFDNNPCDDHFVEDALKAARKFYEQANKVIR